MTLIEVNCKLNLENSFDIYFLFFFANYKGHRYVLAKFFTYNRGFIKFLCRRPVGFFSQAFLVFLVKESKKRGQKQLGKLPGAWPLMNPLYEIDRTCLAAHSLQHGHWL